MKRQSLAVRRESFDSIADLYAVRRPEYPEALYNMIIQYAGLPPGGAVLEIGCGPGTASLPLARRGYAMVCMDSGERLCELARERMAEMPKVSVLCTRFEDWPLEKHKFDLAMAAMSIHWIAPQIAYTKTAHALKPGGTLAIVHNFSYPSSGIQLELDTMAARHLSNRRRKLNANAKPGGVARMWRTLVDRFCGNDSSNAVQYMKRQLELMQDSNNFTEIITGEFPVDKTFSADEYIEFMRTYSDFNALESSIRKKLEAEMHDLITREGGNVTRHYRSCLILGKTLSE